VIAAVTTRTRTSAAIQVRTANYYRQASGVRGLAQPEIAGHAPAEAFKGVAEEQLDVVGLQAAGPRLVHLSTQLVQLVRSQRLAGQGPFSEKIFGSFADLVVDDTV
jgi:hypothetical protein